MKEIYQNHCFTRSRCMHVDSSLGPERMERQTTQSLIPRQSRGISDLFYLFNDH